MAPLPHQMNKLFTPIYNNLFEITHKGKPGVDYRMLTEQVEGYELRPDREQLIITYSASMENLYNLQESVKTINHATILLHDVKGDGFMKIEADIKYLGPIIKQNYNSQEFFSFHAAFKLMNCNIGVLKGE